MLQHSKQTKKTLREIVAAAEEMDSAAESYRKAQLKFTEKVALFAAAARYPGMIIRRLAVSALKQGRIIHQTVTPCGGCRQVISEYQIRQNQPIEIIMEGHGGKVQVAWSIDMLLPFKFSIKHLD